LPPQHRDQPGVDAAHLGLPERLAAVAGEEIRRTCLDEVVDDALQRAGEKSAINWQRVGRPVLDV
jgi:hypothetical protein